ncbi:hypothetical protein chiPu_0026433, partial [Chiloscyllium punctatum]|nr:hypothetical protein [Chiloscyllium punctatum]
ALPVALRDGVRRAEVHHVQRADRADIRHAAADDGAETVLGGREHAAHQEVADLGRGEVDHAGELAGLDQLLHRAAADAGGVEHETLEILAQVGRDLLHRRRGDAEHGDADRGQAGARLALLAGLVVEPCLDHADQRMGAVAEHGARDRVEALHVGDRVHHGDVGGPDIGADVAGCDRGNDELGHADRQRPHAGRDQRRAARAARGNDAGDIALAPQPAFERFRHRRHRSAAIGAEHARAAATVVQRDLLRGDVAARCSSAGRDIDQSGAQAATRDDIADEAQLGALGVERADHQHDRRPRHSGCRRFAPLAGGLFEPGDTGGLRPRGGFDAGDRHRLRPTRRRHQIGNIDAERPLTFRLRRAGSFGLRRSRSGVGLIRAVGADAEQPLLQLAVGGEAGGIDDAVDPAIDHDGDVARYRRRHADVLLDDQDGDVAFIAEAQQHIFDLCNDHRRKPLGRLVHDQQMRVGEQRARDREHLLLAAGELVAAIVLALGEAREDVVDALDGPGAAAQAAGERKVFVDGQRAPQPPALRHIADAEPGDPRRIE